VLTVPDMRTKLALQIDGLGFGFLPVELARDPIADGRLIEKQVEEPRAAEPVHLAWRSGEEGAALAWWRERLRQPGTLGRLTACWHEDFRPG